MPAHYARMIGAVDNTQAYRSPLLTGDAAAELPDADTSLIDAAGVAWHYGNPLGEQRALQGGSIVIDRSHRAVIKVAGPDAGAFLNNLLSQKLIDIEAGFSASVLDLDIQGHILHHADLTYTGEAYYLDFPTAQRSSFIEFLNKMVFWSNVEITETDFGVLTILGQGAAATAGGVEGAIFTRSVGWATTPRVDVVIKRGRLRDVVDKLGALGAPLAGLMAFTAERVKAGEPELRADLDEKSIAHEAPYLINRGEHLGAVHLNKGCYRGQETVARVENLGRSPRLQVLLQLDGSAPIDPVPGADITLAGRKVGRLGTVVHDADYGPIALALIKRTALDRGDLTIESETPIAATVDPDSLPESEGDKAGRKAVERLRGKE